MPNSPAGARISLQEVEDRANTAQHIVTGVAHAMPNTADLWQQIAQSLADIPILTAEVIRLDAELMRTRLERANLAAAARATIAACRDGHRDAISYVHDELEVQGFTSDKGQP